MELEKYQDVHPNWHLIEELSKPEARATLRLLLAGAFMDGKLTAGELQALAETWQRLPFVGPQLSGESLEQLLRDTHDELEQMHDDPQRFNSFVGSIADKIGDQEKRIAVLRLLAIVLTEDGTEEREQALLYATGHHFDLEPDTVDDLVRSVWESYEESTVSSPGKRRRKPILEGKHWSEMRSNKPHPNPFTMPLN